MTEMKREILTDIGSKINVLGKTIIDIDINGYVCLHFAVVPDGILGFDFQRTQDCTINVAKGSILIHGHKVSLQFERKLGFYQEATLKPARMPARRETIVERKGKQFLEKEQCPVYEQLKEN